MKMPKMLKMLRMAKMPKVPKGQKYQNCESAKKKTAAHASRLEYAFSYVRLRFGMWD